MIFVAASLATYYLALGITSQDGPFAVFLALRNRFVKDTWLARGLRCLVCMSCWTGLLATLYLLWLREVGDEWPIVWLGVAGASVAIDKWWRR